MAPTTGAATAPSPPGSLSAAGTMRVFAVRPLIYDFDRKPFEMEFGIEPRPMPDPWEA